MLFKSHAPSSYRYCLIAAAASILLAGCTADRTTTGSIRRSLGMSTAASSQASSLEMLGARYRKNPTDKTVAIQYADKLTASDRIDQALAVMRKLVIVHPKDSQILAAYGKALARSGNYEAALDAVRRAQRPELPDWSLLSTEAGVLDQMGETEEARATYKRALQLAPAEASLLSNVAMSYLLSGQPQASETYLRQALKLNNSDPRLRQNLAFVLGVQGKVQEARNLYETSGLSPAQVEENMGLFSRINVSQVTRK